MNELSKLESKLLEKGLEKFTKEINEGVDIIVKAIENTYTDTFIATNDKGFKGRYDKELEEFIHKLINVHIRYSGADYTKVTNRSNVYIGFEFVPQVIKDSILNTEIDNLLQVIGDTSTSSGYVFGSGLNEHDEELEMLDDDF